MNLNRTYIGSTVVPVSVRPPPVSFYNTKLPNPSTLHSGSAASDTTSMLTQMEWAVAERMRLQLLRGKSEEAATRSAAQHAPKMMKAAQSLAKLSQHERYAPLIPACIKEFAQEHTQISDEEPMSTRFAAWLEANPWELRKCKTPLAAISCAAHIIEATDSEGIALESLRLSTTEREKMKLIRETVHPTMTAVRRISIKGSRSHLKRRPVSLHCQPCKRRRGIASYHNPL